ncbi:MAG: VC1465 family Xer recombination activation factor [Methylophilaceae bacterium]|nr:VC1465 family Xer recombination activation factor [Methylophilaceae bacterium]
MPTKKTKRKWVDREAFYVARRRAGLTPVKAAEMLDVTERTIRNWENGTSDIPYAAFRVVRLAGGYVLAGKGWEGWTFSHGKLWTPENRSFEPHELRYVANYLSMARIWLDDRKSKTKFNTPTPYIAEVSPLASAKASPLPPASRVPHSGSGVRPLQDKPQGLDDAAVLQIKPIIGDNAGNSAKFRSIDASQKNAANDDIMQEVL